MTTKALARKITEDRLREATRAALQFGIGPSQIQIIVAEECIDAVDYPKAEQHATN